jgi:hypothetical protein
MLPVALYLLFLYRCDGAALAVLAIAGERYHVSVERSETADNALHTQTQTRDRRLPVFTWVTLRANANHKPQTTNQKKKTNETTKQNKQNV